MSDKKRELRQPWQDARPLVVMAGDSHVELGDWYGLLNGAFAIRNCGLSRAKITDVTDLVVNINSPNPKIVVLMCGVNSLDGKGQVAGHIRDYQQLLAATKTTLHPEKIIVLSVMPVRESALNNANHEFNEQIAQFDILLQALCLQHEVEFVNVNPIVGSEQGGLAEELTVDGLHLNRMGYQKLAGVLGRVLSETLPPNSAGKAD